MAAQVIYLDVDDEITSAVTRIRQAPAGGVVLVVPFGSRLASSRINFRLLAREAAALRRDLTIVAPDAGTRALAASAGLATHATVLEWEQVTGGGAAGPGPRAGGAPPVGAAARPRGGVRAGDPARGPSQLPLDAEVEAAAGPGGGGAMLPASRLQPLPPARQESADPWRATPSAASIPVVGPPRRLPFGRGRIVAVVVILAVIGAVAGFAATAILPSAEITVTPATEAVGPLALTVTADPAVTIPDPDRQVIPAVRLSLPLSVTATFQATGKLVTDVKATGSVTFTSVDTGSAHTFPGGTVVRTSDGIEFTTVATVSLGRAKFNPPTPATASVGVTAVKSGPEANVAAGSIRVIAANPDPVTLSVANASATAGGLHTESPQVQKSDVDAALVTLRTRLNEAFAAKLADPASIPADTALVPQTQKLGDATPSTDPTALVNQQVASFDLGLAATATAIAVNAAPVTGIAEAKLAASLPSGYQLVDGSVKVTVDPPAASGEIVTFAVRARGDEVRKIDANVLRSQVLGKSIAAARTILEPYGDVRITVWPDWVTAIPGSDAKVRLSVAPTATASPAPSGGTPRPSGSGSGTPPATIPSRSPATSPAASGTKQ